MKCAFTLLSSFPSLFPFVRLAPPAPRDPGPGDAEADRTRAPRGGGDEDLSVEYLEARRDDPAKVYLSDTSGGKDVSLGGATVDFTGPVDDTIFTVTMTIFLNLGTLIFGGISSFF